MTDGGDPDAEGSDPDTDLEGSDPDTDLEGSDPDTDLEGSDPDTDLEADDTAIQLSRFLDVVEHEERPVLTAQQAARRLDCTQAQARDALEDLTKRGEVERIDVETDPVVYYPTEWRKLARRERVVVFPSRREIVVDQPTQYTRAQLSQFAHLVDTTGTEPGTRGYLYRVRPEDVWVAPFEEFEQLLSTVRSVLPRRYSHLEEWMNDQWQRAHQFRLYTHEEGYVVLEAASESLMGNVATEKLEEDAIRAPISDTEAWVNADRIAGIKRTLYDAGYPVVDDRELETGDGLGVELTTDLREYQHSWVESFLEKRAGVFVGPPGSGKTVAAIATITAVEGETLILVPSRELAEQWREELLAHTDLEREQIGAYHGGEKRIRPVTIATYQTAGMDRHRQLFDSRKWGLIVYDEVHHVPSDVYRRSADLQAVHRLGLSATPVREDDSEAEIFTLIGPPIGTDWDALFEAGFVQEPELEIRYVPWREDTARNEYTSADGRERYRLAAQNPAKLAEIEYLLARHDDRKALVFVDYLEQGDRIAEALSVPFVSGDTPHYRREQLFSQFREGERRTLVVSRIADEGIDLPDAEVAIVASGLGGSRRQGAQRAGRTMRPAGSALVFVLATRGTREEEFARRQLRHLAGKGIRVRETNVSG